MAYQFITIEGDGPAKKDDEPGIGSSSLI